MLKIIKQKSGETFQNPKVIAYFENSKIRLDIDSSKQPENFLEMYKKRQPINPSLIINALLTNGFTLANLGISVALELRLPRGDRFAVFTRRGADYKCLALISGYWDASIDPTPETCAKRELLEEFLVFQQSDHKFIIPKGMRFPYEGCQYISSKCWKLIPTTETIEWVLSAKLEIAETENCRIYIDATTSSAQLVYGYYAEFSDWQELSIFHAEDRADEHNNLVTWLEEQGIVLFPITNDCLVNPGYYLKEGQLVAADLPEDAYFHPSMVGANQFGIVSSDKVFLKNLISSK
ncbi:hypothetical protein H6G64_33195 [Calothrix sp. FACHB-156]|nr:hypothetical protein [Calothrix sp. FACHB-156]